MTAIALRHVALSYPGSSGFAVTAAAILREALAGGATPVLFADPHQAASVRTELGPDAEAMVTIDRSVAGRNPARLIPVLQKLVDTYRDGSLRCVGESLRPADSPAVRDEMTLHELMLQLPAFRQWNCHMFCMYDEASPPELAADIRACHAARVDPADAVERALARPLPSRPVDSEELGVDRTTLSALRSFIEGRAVKAGLDDERVDDLVYAVNEAVTNSICHGEGRARVRFWTAEGTVACEVRDRGWIRERLAGRIAPDPDQASGRGLWLVNQLCDLVQLRSSPAGTTVRMLIDA